MIFILGLRTMKLQLPFVAIGAMIALSISAQAEDQSPPPTMGQVLEHSSAEDWARFDSDNLYYMEVGTGRVVIATSPDYAPIHSSNLSELAQEGFYDGLNIYRVQENYVVQWGDIDETKDTKRGKRGIAAEFEHENVSDIPFTQLPDQDGYAAKTGFSGPFYTARLEDDSKGWLTHCPGALGMARDTDPNSGGTELYVVIGHAPRHLDRNTTVFGRVIWGMEHLSTLKRGTGPLGFYEDEKERVGVTSIRRESDVPESERINLEYFRTDTPAFSQLVESRRNRREEWFHYASGYVELCNIPIPVREVQ